MIITIGAAKTPSTAFCLLLRLFTLRCSEKQMKLMLEHIDSPYIRCVGFLYLRYAADPTIVWKWCKPYFYDEEPVKIRANVNCKEITVGQFVRDLLSDLDYYGTRLPRFPIAIEREIKVKLLEEEKVEERAQRHLNDPKVMQHFESIGSKVQALYGDEENEITWYDAVIDRVIRTNEETGVEYYRPKFMVTFPEYGNTEIVEVGEMDMPGVDHSATFKNYSQASFHNNVRGRNHRHNDRDRYDRRRDDGGYDRRDRDRYDGRESHSRGYHERRNGGRYDRDRSRSRDRGYHSQSNFMDEVLRREREKITTGNQRGYARPPPTFKQSLENDGRAKARNMHHESAPRAHDDKMGRANNDNVVKKSQEDSKPPPVQKTPEELAAIAAKKRKLLAKYG